LTAFQELQFDDEAKAFDFALRHLDEFGDGLGSATGSENVINDDDILAGKNGVWCISS
jgi:hypothetical protein